MAFIFINSVFTRYTLANVQQWQKTLLLPSANWTFTVS